MMKLVAIVAFTSVLFSCSKSSGLSEDELKAVRLEVENMLMAYHRDVKASGLLAEFDYLDSSRDFSWTPPGFDSPISYDSVATILRKYAPRFKSVDNSFDSLSVVVIDKDSATFSGTIRSVSTDTVGVVTDVMLTESGTVVRRRDGWRLLNGKTKVLRRN